MPRIEEFERESLAEGILKIGFIQFRSITFFILYNLYVGVDAPFGLTQMPPFGAQHLHKVMRKVDVNSRTVGIAKIICFDPIRKDEALFIRSIRMPNGWWKSVAECQSPYLGLPATNYQEHVDEGRRVWPSVISMIKACETTIQVI